MASADTKQVDRYLASCREHNVKPNSAAIKQFSAAEGRKTEVFDFQRNYLGPNGFLPVLHALPMNYNFTALIVSGNGLRNQCIEKLVETVELHDPLTHLDVSDNVISDGGAKHLLRLLQANPSVVELKVHNNPMDEHFFSAIKVALQKNIAAQEEIANELAREQEEHDAEMKKKEETERNAKALTKTKVPSNASNASQEVSKTLSGLGEEESGEVDQDVQASTTPQRTVSNESNDSGLKALLLDLFAKADTDGSGTLSAAEFRELMRGASLGLSRHEISVLFSEADFDSNGDINYNEFIPVALDVVKAVKEREVLAASLSEIERETREKARNMLIKGVPKNEWKKMMFESFAMDDKNKDGLLDKREFIEGIKKANRESGLGLTKKEINALLHQVDLDKDGQISFDEFFPVIEEIVFEVAYRNWEKLSGGSGDSPLEAKIYNLVSKLDPEGTGRALPKEIKAVLEESDLGLSRMHIYVIFSQIEQDQTGRVVIGAVCRATAYVVKNFYDTDGVTAKYDGARFTREEFASRVVEAFKEVDTEGGGHLSTEQFKQVLEKATEKQPTDTEYNAFFMSADTNKDGTVSLDELKHFAAVLYDGLVVSANADFTEKIKSIIEEPPAVSVEEAAASDAAIAEEEKESADTPALGEDAIDQGGEKAPADGGETAAPRGDNAADAEENAPAAAEDAEVPQ